MSRGCWQRGHEQGTDPGVGPGPGRGADGVERDHRRTDDLASSRVSQTEVQPRCRVGPELPEREEDEGCRGPTASPDGASHPKSVRSERPGELGALGIGSLDQDLVAAQSGGNPGRPAGNDADATTPRRHVPFMV